MAGKVLTHLALECMDTHTHVHNYMDRQTGSCKPDREADGDDTWMNKRTHTHNMIE